MAPRFTLVALVVAVLSVAQPRVAAGKCKMIKIAELPVTMSGMRPTVPATVNGTEVRFIADSGAFNSVISPAVASELKLNVKPGSIKMHGVGGTAVASLILVRDFRIGDLALPSTEFMVGGSEPGVGAAGLLGQNVLGIADVEYDLANGVIRLMRPQDCGKESMAYWVSEPQRYSTIDITRPTDNAPHTRAVALLNGKRVRVLFDTGASASVLSVRGADRAGVKISGGAVEEGGFWRGVGRKPVQTWMAPFRSLRIGDEEIQHTKLRIGDIDLHDADMLIGADFFLSHRIYVAQEQRKLYFTFNGGSVFDQTDVNEPVDAAGFSRRGNAFAARNELERAIADLTRACDLAPTEGRYFHERGLVYRKSEQHDLALKDFDEAVKLMPADVSARVTRAEARLAQRQREPALSDLDAADSSASKSADIRFVIAMLYARAGAFEPAIVQYDLWLAAHEHDARRIEALNGRCSARGLLSKDLDKALSDCNGALDLRPNTPPLLASRGLIHFRLGNYDAAIADYDAALRDEPNSSFFLYTRGLAKLRKGLSTAGQSDIGAATALRPRIAEEAKLYGLTPD